MHPDWKYLTWCFVGTCAYFVFSPLWLNLGSLVPDIDTKSKFYENWHYRYIVNTTWFPVSSFVAYMLLCISGWVFINWFNCQRANPFTSGNKHYKDFYIMLAVAPILFLFSGNIVLR